MKIFILLILSSFTLGCASQTKINEGLKKELDDMMYKDQIFREYSDNQTSELRKEEIAKITKHRRKDLDNNLYLYKLMTDIDSTNLIRIESIIKTYGYPGNR